MDSRRIPPWGQRALVLGVTWVIALSGMARAWARRWSCDDAFVSFRYADNLAHGHGLVWNVGERVEGFSNLVWTLLFVPAAAAGLDLVTVSEVLGVLSLAGLGAVLWLWTREGEASPPGPPLALWATFAMSDLLDWSTGGLETMTFTALGAALALALFGAERTTPRREWLAGALGGLLVATRADGVLLAAALGGAFLAQRTLRAKRLEWPAILRVAGPTTLTLVALTLFRLRYYGDPLPNTFYAKSAGQGYAQQGFTYLVLLAARDWGLPASLVLAFAASAWRRHGRGATATRAVTAPRAAVGAAPVLLAAAVFAAYVVRSGGDFMFARRLVPLVPLAFMAAERALVPAFAPAARLGMGVAAVVAMSLPYPLYERFGEGGRIARVSDERTFYPEDVVSFRKAQAAALAEAFRGIDTTFVIRGGLCMVAYYSGLPRVIEPNGLTDRTIARQPLAARGTPGHEKMIPEGYLEKRRAPFVIDRVPLSGPVAVDKMSVGGGIVQLGILFYDPPVMEALARRPGVALVPIEAVLAGARRDVRAATCGDARDMLTYLDLFYFRWAPRAAPDRAAFASAVDARCTPAR